MVQKPPPTIAGASGVGDHAVGLACRASPRHTALGRRPTIPDFIQSASMVRIASGRLGLVAAVFAAVACASDPNTDAAPSALTLTGLVTQEGAPLPTRRWRRDSGVCGHGRDRPQLMRMSLGRPHTINRHEVPWNCF